MDFFFLVFVFLLISSQPHFTMADQISNPIAAIEEANTSFLGRRTAFATGGLAAIITLALVLAFNTKKQRVSKEKTAHHPSLEVLRCFSFIEIASAVENFSPFRGYGGVYGGFIDDGKQRRVSIVWLSIAFLNEAKPLFKLRHDNLVSLIGYCIESKDMILVYESFLPLVTLSDHLHRSTPLSWEQRLVICIEAARGMDYLHTSTDHGVTHGDLKSSNIILDENYKPKIKYFGLTEQGAKESDVYSFGIVLLEVLSGKTSENSGEEKELISWAKNLIRDGDIDQIVDHRLNDQISSKCLKGYVTLFSKCLHDDPKIRPTMIQVAARLARLLDHNYVSGERMVQAKPNVSSKETTSCNELSQCLSMAKFFAATLSFSNYYLWYDGIGYKIYNAPCGLLSNQPSRYIICRGQYMPNDISKVAKLSKLRHPNLASMVGYCCKDSETIVGYKTEGTVSLYYERRICYLSWPERLGICIDIAGAVRCIHAAKIIHGGISPTNILLDDSYSVKLANFGSFSSHWGCCNDLPPDIGDATKMTEKSDVYLFGMLLFIVLCGSRVDFSGGYPFRLHVKVVEAIKQRSLHDISDVDLKGIEDRCLDTFLEVAFGCCSPKQVDRPSMDKVLEVLQKVRLMLMCSYADARIC